MIPRLMAATPVRSIENASFAPSRYGRSSVPPSSRSLPTRTSVRNSIPVGDECIPILRIGPVCSKPGMPLSSTKLRILRSAGGLPSSSLQMKTVVSAYGPFVMNVFDPLSRYSSPSRFALDAMRPNASEPESDSVIAHAPTLSKVSRSSAHFSFCSVVPRLMIVAAARPVLTPIAVTRPGEHRQSSMIGSSMNPAPGPPPSPSSDFGASAPPFSLAMRRSNDARAMSPMPNVEYSLRITSYGGVSPNSSSSRRGRTSFSTKSRTASRIILCSSDHSYTASLLLDSAAEVILPPACPTAVGAAPDSNPAVRLAPDAPLVDRDAAALPVVVADRQRPDRPSERRTAGRRRQGHHDGLVRFRDTVGEHLHRQQHAGDGGPEPHRGGAGCEVGPGGSRSGRDRDAHLD